MLHSEITFVCSAIHTEHMKALCGKKTEFFLMITLWYTKQQLDFKGLKMVLLSVFVGKNTSLWLPVTFMFVFFKSKAKTEGIQLPIKM
jgi:hypothetical protein